MSLLPSPDELLAATQRTARKVVLAAAQTHGLFLASQWHTVMILMISQNNITINDVI
jgi:hypothetical protein